MNRGSGAACLVCGTFLAAFLTMPAFAKAEPAMVGVFLPLTGQNAVIGHIQKNAMLLALDEVNRKAGHGLDPVLGLDIRDAKDRPRDARNIVRHFITDKQYPLIIAGGVSGTVWTAAGLCQRERTPVIVVTGSEDRITSEGLGYVFRIAPPRSLYPAAAVEFARSVLRPEKIALVTEKTGFGDSLARGMKAAAREEGWNVAYEGSFGFGPEDQSRIINGVQSSGAQAVFIAAFPPEAGLIMEEFVQAFPGKVIINLVPSSAAEDAFVSCGQGCLGVFSSALWWAGADETASVFRDSYLERFGAAPDYHGAQAYAAVLAASMALKGIDPADREAVAVSLKGIRTGSPMGPVSFHEWGAFRNQNLPPTYLLQWFGDRFEVVWPEKNRTAEPLMPGKGLR